MLLETELLKNNNNNKKPTKTKQNPENKKNEKCIKSGLPQFLFLQQKM